MLPIRAPLIALLASLPAGQSVAAEAPLPSGVVRIVEPEIEKATIIWPGLMNREALVILEFTLKADGTITDLEVAEGGFHEPRFVEAAKRVVNSARIRPKQIDGKAVDTAQKLAVKFEIKGTQKGVTKEFTSELRKVEDFIKRGDYAGGHFHAQWMLTEKVKLGFEYAVLQSELAFTHTAVGNSHRALIAARTATTRTDSSLTTYTLHQPVPGNSEKNYLLPKPLVTRLLDLRIRHAVSNGLMFEAMQAYYDLAGLAPFAPDDPHVKLAEMLTERLESHDPLVGSVRIDESGDWSHALFRRSFHLQNIKGHVTGMDLRCVGKKRGLTYQPDVTWTIPRGWNGCKLRINGEPDTAVEIVELSDDSAGEALATQPGNAPAPVP